MDVRVKLGDYMILGLSYLTLWTAGPVLRTFVQYLIAFCSRLEAKLVKSYLSGL